MHAPETKDVPKYIFCLLNIFICYWDYSTPFKAFCESEGSRESEVER